MSYGTGAIMAVPAHDTRDYEFAKTFNLPIVEVVAGGDVSKEAYTECEHGRMVNSGFLNGMEVAEAKKAIADYLEKEGIGHRKVNYKLRDWVFARQRYWGEPIPLVKCEKCGWVPLPESELPLKLPMLYLAPFFNVTGADVCLGNSALEKPLDTDFSGSCKGLAAHHLPALRRPRRARSGHHAQLGGLQLVLPALYRPA